MKYSYTHFLVIPLFFVLFVNLQAQTTLAAGDLMIVTVNADGNDNFDFVPLVDMEANTVIKFTDNPWDGSALLTNEGTLTYTASASVTAGSVVSFSGSAGGEWSSSGSYNASSSGDNIIVYQGSAGSETFIYGIGWARGTSWITSGTVTSNYSYIPTGLSENDNTIVNLSTSDNYQYDTSNGITGPKSTLRYLTAQNGNYNGNNTSAYAALSNSFTVGQGISGNSGFRILSSPVSGTVYDDLLAPLWTQGMTGGDVTGGDANVWTYDASSASWSALTNLTTASYTAGTGVLVYVFSDVDNDGYDDLPVYLSVTGSENSATVSVTTTASEWNLLGNPFEATIDADQLFTDNSNYSSTVYVWDDASGAYKTWNGSTGDLTNGLIAPYQGFWIESGASGTSFDFTANCKSSTAGTFFKQINNSSGSAYLTFSTDERQTTVYLSFNPDGLIGIDHADAYRLLPLDYETHLTSMFYVEDSALTINNLPSTLTEKPKVMLDVMMLEATTDSFITTNAEVAMSWNLSDLPSDITLILEDTVVAETINLMEMSSYNFSTNTKGGFAYNSSEEMASYPKVGESRFSLTINYDNTEVEDEIMPVEFMLYPPYPNPFNSSTTISFNLPNTIDMELAIYDILCRKMDTLVSGVTVKGEYNMVWDAQNLASGIYLIKLSYGDKTFSRKITFLK